MTTFLKNMTIVLAAAAGLSACEKQEDVVSRDAVVFEPVYQGVETRLLEGDLVNFHVEMTGARHTADVASYAECAAAQYTLIRGYGFARHVRTNVELEGETWRADSVYTISPALPRGLKTIDAEVTLSNCDENGIPTV